MHGPDGKSFPNESRFIRIITDEVFEIEHLNGHHFILTIELKKIEGVTEVKWSQLFDTTEQYARIARFVAQANEQNLERLAIEVQQGGSAASPEG